MAVVQVYPLESDDCIGLIEVSNRGALAHFSCQLQIARVGRQLRGGAARRQVFDGVTQVNSTVWFQFGLIWECEPRDTCGQPVDCSWSCRDYVREASQRGRLREAEPPQAGDRPGYYEYGRYDQRTLEPSYILVAGLAHADFTRWVSRTRSARSMPRSA